MFCLNFVLVSCIDSVLPRVNGVQQGWVLPMEKDTIDNIIWQFASMLVFEPIHHMGFFVLITCVISRITITWAWYP
jgi:hypothetical protein